jgi:hypothetical protein
MTGLSRALPDGNRPTTAEGLSLAVAMGLAVDGGRLSETIGTRLRLGLRVTRGQLFEGNPKRVRDMDLNKLDGNGMR